MAAAIAKAEAGLAEGGIPIGSVLVYGYQAQDRRSRPQFRRVHAGSAYPSRRNAMPRAGRPIAGLGLHAERSLHDAVAVPRCGARGAILLYKIPRATIGENVTFMGREEDLLRSRAYCR